jgi:hypothetical protein
MTLLLPVITSQKKAGRGNPGPGRTEEVPVCHKMISTCAVNRSGTAGSLLVAGVFLIAMASS